MRRARAASSPFPHACKRFVISAVRASMDFPSPAHPTRELQRIYKNRGRFWRIAVACTGGRRKMPHHDLPPESRKQNEISNDHGADGEPWCRKRLRTTEPGKDDVFGKWCAQRD